MKLFGLEVCLEMGKGILLSLEGGGGSKKLLLLVESGY